jgi:hypothetical protein
MTSLERQGACLCERCVTVGKHATGSVGRSVGTTPTGLLRRWWRDAGTRREIGRLQMAPRFHVFRGVAGV